MRVAINALASKGEGSLTYLLNILPELSRLASGISFTVYANSGGAQKISTHIGRSQANFNIKVIEAANGSPIRRVIWEQTRLARLLKEDRIDVLYAPAPPIPIHCPVPTVVAVRNMEPLCPHVWPLVTVKERLRYLYLRFATWWSLRAATRIICVSKASYQLLSANYPVDMERLTIIHHGRSLAFHPMPRAQAEARVEQALGIQPPFILYVSKTRPYKNHIELVRALAKLRDRCGRFGSLVLAGEKQEPYCSQIEDCVRELRLHSQVQMPGEVSYELLPSLYNAALLFVYPSTCEACPNIVIEALGCGVSSAVSHLPVLQEICEDAVAYFDPFDPDSIASVMADLLANADKRLELGAKAQQRAERFSWRHAAEQTLAVIKAAVECA